MALSTVGAAPPAYALQSPRPDLKAAAGTMALAAGAPSIVSTEPHWQPDWKKEHTQLVEMFEEAEDASCKNRELAERDVDYHHNKQWDEKDAKKIRDRGQPVLMKNRIRRKIKYLQGLEQQQRTDPRAVPRTPKHEQDAYAATACLRFVNDQNRYNQTRSKVFWDVAVPGWGGTETVIEMRPGMANPMVVTRRCQWDRMWWDPYSQEEDFSDARRRGMVLWMDRDEAIQKYGEGAEKVFDETIQTASVGGTYDDKPKYQTWVSYEKKRWRVRVVQAYFRAEDGMMYFSEFTKGGLLNYGASPWLDENGQPEDPYSWGSANVDRDNQRYGEVRSMIDLQDAINKRESKLLHLVSVRQTFGSQGAFGKMSVNDMKKELSKPDGHIPLREGVEFGKQFGVIPTGDMADAQFQILQADNAEMDLEGPNAAMMGKGRQDQSGRALLAQQQGGAIEQSGLMDTLRDIDLRTYRKQWNRIRQSWTAEQWVSVTDDMRNLKWVGINQPAMQPVVDPSTGAPAIDPQTGQPAMAPVIDPMTGQPKLQNPVSELDVDITIDDAPHVGTMQDEEFGRMVELAKIVPALQQMDAATWIGASNLKNKAELAQKVSEQQQAAGQRPDPEQVKAQAQLQLEQAKLQMQAQAKQAETAANMEADRMRAEQEMVIAQRKADQEIAITNRKAAVDLEIIQTKAQADIAIRAQAAQAAAANKPADRS